jgi:hypothetical protein
LDGPLPKLRPAVAISHQDGHHSAVVLLLKAALIPVSDYRLLGASGFIKFSNFNTFRLIFKKNVKFKLQKCAACQDLPTLQFLSKSHYPFWSYCPFFIKYSKF